MLIYFHSGKADTFEVVPTLDHIRFKTTGDICYEGYEKHRWWHYFEKAVGGFHWGKLPVERIDEKLKTVVLLLKD